MLESEDEDVKLDQSGQLKDKKQISENDSAITKTSWNWGGDMDGGVLPRVWLRMNSPRFSSNNFMALLFLIVN